MRDALSDMAEVFVIAVKGVTVGLLYTLAFGLLFGVLYGLVAAFYWVFQVAGLLAFIVSVVLALFLLVPGVAAVALVVYDRLRGDR